MGYFVIYLIEFKTLCNTQKQTTKDNFYHSPDRADILVIISLLGRAGEIKGESRKDANK